MSAAKPADPMAFAHAARRAKLLGTLEACSVSRAGLPAAARYAVVERAVGVDALDAHQQSVCYRVFEEALRESSSHMRAAAFVAAEEEEDVTEVAPPPVRVRKTRRFLYWLLPCLALGCSGVEGPRWIWVQAPPDAAPGTECSTSLTPGTPIVCCIDCDEAGAS